MFYHAFIISYWSGFLQAFLCGVALDHNNFYSNLSGDIKRGHIPDLLINENYYTELGYQSTFNIFDLIMTFFYIAAGIIIAMSCRAVTQKYNRELFILKVVGLSKHKIVFTYKTVLLIFISVPALIAFGVSSLFMYMFSLFSVESFTGSNIIPIQFVIPIANFIYAFLITTATAIIIYGISLSMQLKNTPIISGINNTSYYTVSQVSRSAQTEAKNVGFLGWLYFKRTLHSSIINMLLTTLILLLPMLLLTFALLFKAQNQVQHRDELCMIESIYRRNVEPTLITKDFCDIIKSIDGVKSIKYLDENKIEQSQIWVYANPGMEESVLNELRVLIAGGDYSLYSYYDQIDTTKLLSTSFYYFFLSQSILLAACSFIIILLGQWSALLRRKREFVIYKILGYSPREIAQIMRSRYIDITVSVIINLIIVNILIFIYSRFEQSTNLLTIFKTLPGVAGVLFTLLHIAIIFGFAYAASVIAGRHMLASVWKDTINVSSEDIA